MRSIVFWLERKLDGLIGRLSDRLSEDTGSIRVLVLWSLLISLSCLLRHTQVDTFVLIVFESLWTVEMITNIASSL